MRNIENYSVEVLTEQEMQNVDGGFIITALAVVGGVAALCTCYNWGYEYASRQFNK